MIREQLADARFAFRAWSQGVAWLNVLAGLGMVATGYAQHNTSTFAGGFALCISAFLPRIKPLYAYEVARTLTMKWNWREPPDGPASPPVKP